MKKVLLLLVVAISVCLVVGEAVTDSNKSKGSDKEHGNSDNAQTNDSENGSGQAKSHSGKGGLNNVLGNSSCLSGTPSERAQCRKERREEIKNTFTNCTSSGMNVTDCVQERKRETWQARTDVLEYACQQNSTWACRQLVNTFKECHNETPGPDRAECARNKLRLGKVVSQLVRECGNDTNVSNCIINVSESVYAYVVFKIQDLADRAEGLITLGVNESIVNEFVAFAEDSITAFDEAVTLEEKKQILLDVRHAWQELIREAKASL